jgi:lysophospholipase L1-like esterase
LFIAVVSLMRASGAATTRLSGAAPILCVGDSLTFGVGGDGVTYPGVLATQAKVPTVNLGLSGFIPRHIVYHVFLHELPYLTRQQLEGVPPSEYEERKNQPDINHLRTFITEGQTVWIKEEKASGTSATQYRWDPSATEDGDNTVKPSAVGDASHRPLITTGRWRKISPSVSELPKPKVYRGVIFCVGANGMEADDILRSLRTLIQTLVPPQGHFLVLGLINRADPDKHPEAIADWAKWIAECNQALRSAYPDNFLELQPRFASPATGANSGGYRTRDWIKTATADQVARDAADQARGVLPLSLRAPENSTHLNGVGYTIIGTLAYEWVSQHGWLTSTPPLR